MNLVISLPEDLRPVELENIEAALAHFDKNLICFEINSQSNLLTLEFTNVDDVNEAKIKSKFDQLLTTMRQHVKAPSKEVLFKNNPSITFYEDVFDRLISEHQLFTYGPGVYAISGQFMRWMANLDLSLQKFAHSLGAEATSYPVSIPINILERSLYIDFHPQLLYFLSTLHADSDDILQYKKNKKDLKKSTKQACRPSVCLHCYPQFENKIIKNNSYQCITAAGPIFRNESIRATGLERLNEFTMREIIFIGDAEFVSKKIKNCLSEWQSWMENFGLSGSITTANDPFFSDRLSTMQAYQLSHASKLEVCLGVSQSGKSIAVSSLNNHGQHFAKAFNIQLSNGQYAHSGCVGFGLERLVFAILSQYGLDQSKWPVKLKEFAQECHF